MRGYSLETSFINTHIVGVVWQNRNGEVRGQEEVDQLKFDRIAMLSRLNIGKV